MSGGIIVQTDKMSSPWKKFFIPGTVEYDKMDAAPEALKQLERESVELLMQGFMDLQELKRFLENERPVTVINLIRDGRQIGAMIPEATYAGIKAVLLKHCIEEIEDLRGGIVEMLGADRDKQTAPLQRTDKQTGKEKARLTEDTESTEKGTGVPPYRPPRRDPALKKIDETKSPGACIEEGCTEPKATYGGGNKKLSRCLKHHREMAAAYAKKRDAEKKN